MSAHQPDFITAGVYFGYAREAQARSERYPARSWRAKWWRWRARENKAIAREYQRGQRI